MRSGKTRGLRVIPHLLLLTFHAWRRDHASLMAAALAFYSLISIAPLLIILLSVAGSYYDPEQVRGSAILGVQAIAGEEAAALLESMVRGAALAGTGWTVTLVSVAIVIYGSTRVFVELQSAMHVIWREPGEPGGGFEFLRVIRTHLASFVMVLGVGLLWLAGIVSSTVISAVTAWVADRVPEGMRFAGLVHGLASVALLSLSAALIYRLLPDRRPRWGNVWVGALLTGVLVTAGQRLIGVYLGYKTISSVYGAAGSLVVVIFWFYYSWMVFLLGAEFTKVHATSKGDIPDK